MKDSEITELFWRHDEKAIDELSKKYENILLKLAFNILGNREDCEECVNDTYLKLWNLIPPNKPRSIKAYSFKIIRNLALNRYQKTIAGKRNNNMTVLLSELEDCIPSTSDFFEEDNCNTLVIAINDYLYTLDREKQTLFVRRYFYAESSKKIAEDLNIPENRINVILFRIRQDLKKHLNNKGVKF